MNQCFKKKNKKGYFLFGIGGNKFLYLHPAKGSSYCFLGLESGREINLKIFSKKLARKKKMLTFAPALRMKAVLKREEYVHRHIELTAVLIVISEQIKESKRIGRFEKA